MERESLDVGEEDPVYASSAVFLKFCFASHSRSSSFSGMSMHSILKMTGLVPSLQQVIIMRSSFRPPLHNRAALQCRVHIPADSIPRLTAELTIHQVIEVILLRGTPEQKSIARSKEGTRAGLWISQVLRLKILKALRLQYGYSAFMLHSDLLSIRINNIYG